MVWHIAVMVRVWYRVTVRGTGGYIHWGTYSASVLRYTKLIGHLSSSQLNKSDIFHCWRHSKHKDRLACCMSVQLHLPARIHLTNSCLIKEHWRTNQLTNQQTNLWNCLENGLSDWLTDWISIFCILTLLAVQTPNDQQACNTFFF